MLGQDTFTRAQDEYGNWVWLSAESEAYVDPWVAQAYINSTGGGYTGLNYTNNLNHTVDSMVAFGENVVTVNQTNQEAAAQGSNQRLNIDPISQTVYTTTLPSPKTNPVPEGKVTVGPIRGFNDPNNPNYGSDLLDLPATSESNSPGLVAGSSISITSNRAYDTTQVVGDVLAVSGLIAAGAEYSRYTPAVGQISGFWRGQNGAFYSTNWGGNGATGGKLAFAETAASDARVIGKGLGLAGLAVSGLQLANAIAAGNTNRIVQAGADMGVGLIGFSGPIGAAFSAGYSTGRILDDTFGISDAIAKGIEQPVVQQRPVGIHRGSD